MRSRLSTSGLGASGTTATVFGVLAGLGGLTHGVGEVLQGNVPVDGVFIESWTTGPIARYMGGEPGLTILPTALAAGMATLVVSTAVTLWSARGVRSGRDGIVLAALSGVMLAAGGGVGPPVIGMLAGLVARRGARVASIRRRQSGSGRRLMASAWPALFGVAAANGVFLVLGSLVLVYGFEFDHASVFERSFYLSVLLQLLLLVAAPAHDERNVGAREAVGSEPAPFGLRSTPRLVRTDR